MSSEQSKNESASVKLSCGVATVELLENLVRGTLSSEETAELTTHTDCCPVCAKELSWLRAEKEMFAQRALGVPPSKVWSQVEAQLSQRLAAQMAVQPIGTRFRQRLRAQRLQWLAVGVAAAMMGILAASPLSPLRLHDSLSGLLGRPLFTRSATDGSSKSAAVVAHFDDDEDATGGAGEAEDSDAAEEVTAVSKVTGAVTLSLNTIATDIEVLVGAAGEVRITATDTDVHAVRLVDNGKGRMQAQFDGMAHGGQVRLQLPVGSGVELQTVSGDVVVSEIRGDAVVRTTSGDIHVKGVAKVGLTSTSGDALVERASGPVTVDTTSGELLVRGDVVAPVKFQSTSGDLQIEGACRAGCQVTATTASGDASVRTAKGSFSARLRSRTGEIEGADGQAVDMRRRPGNKAEWTVHIGRGEGRIEVETETGSLSLDHDH